MNFGGGFWLDEYYVLGWWVGVVVFEWIVLGDVVVLFLVGGLVVCVWDIGVFECVMCLIEVFEVV